MKIMVAGAGIGGLTAALSLHAAGFDEVVVLEAAREMREVGVGINLPPHAVRELTELGLGEALARVGVPTAELVYHDADGAPIWAEPRGLSAGYRWPQYSIHRARLQALLLDAVRERLGADAVRLGQRVLRVDDPHSPSLELSCAATGRTSSMTANLVIAADGIRSGLRDALRGSPTPIASNGWVMYRGAARGEAFLTGNSMVIAGDETQRVVVYPIGAGLLNWLAVRPAARTTSDLGNWNKRIAPETVANMFVRFRFDWLDIPALIASSPEAYEYPMADIDPLPRWTYGRCTLLGDAAHAMYPFGSNGASQAILDARTLAYRLATEEGIDAALAAYEDERRPATAQVQLANRRQADGVMARVSEIARRGAHDTAAAELQDAEAHYKKLAGFDVETLNTRQSWNAPPPAERRAEHASPGRTA